MRDGFDRRWNRICRWFAVLVLDRAHRAAAIPGEAEVLPRLGDAVEFARRDVFAHAVDLVVVRPQLAIGRIEIHTDGIPQAEGIDLAAGAVAIDANDAA